MKLKGKKLLWLLSVLVVPVAYSGFAMAEGLEPTAALEHTKKTTTDAWDKKISKAAKRFKIVLGGEAVLDNETGLVWEESPDTSKTTWAGAIYDAYGKVLGGRMGWRLPTIEELASLVDPTRINPALPSGHPFTNVQSGNYWSSTTYVSDTRYAWVADFYYGSVGYDVKSDNFYVWCVRGGHGYDAP